MGNRANIKVSGWGQSLHLYTHWGGLNQTARVVADVMASAEGKARQCDPPYLSRILFERMVADAHDKETGYGVWPDPCDNENPIIELDCDAGTVSVDGADASRFKLTNWEQWHDDLLAAHTKEAK